MSTIDQRIVEMRFDNTAFEKNVSTSMSTLSKLKESLNLSGATKGLESINTATNNVNVSPLTSAVETISMKFSALEVIAVTALANITNSAINAGKQLLSAITIDPILSGFEEYETQMNSIQTILANTSKEGTTLNQVNAALDELNTYSDKTIYNFTEMTRNIGTFTAAGVELDTSVSAIKGIANLAAVSGSNSQQASTAMYQLSQAMAQGYVMLQDWNSVVNAGMGGQVFQDALTETARVHGIAIDEMIDAEGSFRSTLSNQWLTTDILIETLSKFTGDLSEAQLEQMGYTTEQVKEIMALGEMANDAATKVKTFTQLIDTLKEALQSGWSQSFRLIVGDFEEAKAVFTEISDVLGEIINASGEARNEVLTGGLSSGWKQFVSGASLDEDSLVTALREVATECGYTTEELDEMIETAGSFEKTLSSGWVTADMMGDALVNLTEKTKDLSDEQLAEAGYTREQINALGEFNNSIQNGSVSLDEYSDKLTQVSGRENLIQSLRNAFDALLSVITPIKDAFSSIFPPTTAEQVYKITEGIANFTESLILSESTSDKIQRTFSGLFAILNIVKSAFTAVGSVITSNADVAGRYVDCVLSITASIGDWIVNINNLITTNNVFSKGLQGLVDILSTLTSSFISLVKQIGQKINFTGFSEIGTTLQNVVFGMSTVTETAVDMKDGFTNSINSMSDTLEKSGFVIFLTFISDVMKNVGKTIVNVMSSISSSVKNTMLSISFDDITKFFNMIVSGGIGAGLINFFMSLSSAFSGFSDITEGIVDTFSQLEGVLKAYQSSLKADALMKIAVAIGILAVSLLVISTIDKEKMTSSITALTILFTGLISSLSLLNNAGSSLTGAFTTSALLISLSSAILLMSLALKTVSTIDGEQLQNGLTGMVALMGALVISAKLLSSSSSTMITGCTQMVAFAIALNILATACKKLSELSFEELVVGLTGVGILLAQMVIFVKSIGDTKTLISTGIAIIAISSALLIMSVAVKMLATMSWSEMSKGLIGIAGLLTSVTVAMNFMPNNLALTGAGLLAVSTSLVVMSMALSIMGKMSWEEIGKGLITLGGAMVILALGLNAMSGTIGGATALTVASIGLSALTPTLVILGKLSWIEIAKGLIALAGAITIIGIAGLVLTPVVPTMLALGATFALMGAGMLGLGVGLGAVGVGLVTLSTSIAGSSAAIVAGITVILVGVINLIPTMAVAVGDGIISIVSVLLEGVPIIGEAFKTVLLTILDVINEVLPVLIITIFEGLDLILIKMVNYTPSFIDCGMKIIQGFLKGVADNISNVVEEGVNVVLNFLKGISNKLGDIVDTAFNVIISFIDGLANAIRKNDDAIFDACKNLITAITSALTKLITSTIPDIGVNIIKGLVSGVSSMAKSLISSVSGVVSDAISAAKNLLGIKSPSRVFKEIGVFTGEGLVIGMDSMASKVSKSSEGIGEEAMDSMSKALSGISDILECDEDLNPTITPVIDMSNVNDELYSVFNKNHELDITSNAKSASSVQTEIATARGTSNDLQEASSSTNTDNSTLQITNHYTVRNDSDIRKISQGQKNLLDRYKSTKGVLV
ncbi:MAG: tape measure protein [Clostridia bacterium]